MIKYKKKIIIGTSLVIIVGMGIAYTNSTPGKRIIKYKINKIYYSQFEDKEYKNNFKETLYKNYKILHNEEVEIALPLLFSYLDKIEVKSNEILGYIPKEKLTIQLDFDKEIFQERLSIGDTQRHGAGYYNKTLNTIYMNVEDVFREIINNLPKIRENDDSFVIQSMSFKEKLFNLYYNYLLDNFFKDNNLNEQYFPIWFINGLNEYYCSIKEKLLEDK